MNVIEETGTVVAMDDEYIWVQTQARSTCSTCHVGSDCGTSVLAKWFGQRSNRIRVRNGLGLEIGEGAVVGIEESALLKASLLAYLMPMLAMVGAAVAAAGLGAQDAGIALGAMMGLGIGLLALHRFGTAHKQGAYQAQLLRRAPLGNHTLNVVLQRGITS